MTSPNVVRQRRERAAYDRATAHAVLDAGIVCHVGFVEDETPFVIPMLYARDEDRLLLHGAVATRLMRRLATGVSVCISVAHLDGLVLAASAFHHSANYRSLVLFGQARLVTNPIEKAAALERLVEFMLPDRSTDARPASQRELNATTLLSVAIDRYSVKSRSGSAGKPEAKDPSDVWTGVIPLRLCAGTPRVEQDPGHTPDYIRRFVKRRHSADEKDSAWNG